MKTWMMLVALLTVLGWLQLGLISAFRAPFDHVPLLLIFGLYAFFSLRDVWGMAFLLTQGGLFDLIGLSPWPGLLVAFLIGTLVVIVLRTVMTHRSLYTTTVVTFGAVLLWQAGLYAWHAFETASVQSALGEWLMVSFVTSVLMVLVRLILPHWQKGLSRYVRFAG